MSGPCGSKINILSLQLLNNILFSSKGTSKPKEMQTWTGYSKANKWIKKSCLSSFVYLDILTQGKINNCKAAGLFLVNNTMHG